MSGYVLRAAGIDRGASQVKRAYLALLLCLFLVPASLAADTQQIMLDYTNMEIFEISGTSIDYNAYDTIGHIIGQVDIYAPAGSNVSVTLYDSGQTVLANASVSDNLVISGAIGNQTLESGGGANWLSYPIGQDLSSLTRIMHFDYLTSTIYSDDTSSKTVYLRYQTWSSSSGTVVGSASMPLNNIIYRVVISSDKDVRVKIWHDTTASIYGQISDQQKATGSFFDLIWGALSSLYWITYLGYTIFTKIFIENFVVVLTLYETMVAAVAYGKSRDIWTAHRKFIRYNVALFEFMYKALVGFVNIINGVLLRL